MKLSIKWKISIVLLALVFCVFSNFVGIQFWINSSKTYGMIINLAGRQRMLTQKMTKEAMFIANDFNVREDIEKTQELFERTLNSLIDGDKELGLPPAKSDEIRNQLQKVKGLWNKFKPDIIRAVNGELNIASKKIILYSSSLEILEEMNKVVKMMEADSLKSIGRLRTYAILAFFFSLFIAAGGFYYIEKNVINKLRETVDVAKCLKKGDLSARVNISSQDEIGELSSVFNEMAEALEKRLEQEKTFQRKLHEETVLAQAKERRALAQDIHDHLGHSLAILRMKIEEVKTRMPHGLDKIKSYLDESTSLIKEMIQQTRTLIFDLYPVMLDDLGILPTIEWHVKKFNSETGLKTKIVEKGFPAEPSRSVSIYLLRVIKELLNNAFKYAEASEVVVTVKGSDSIFEIIVADDGKGFDPDSILKSPQKFNGIGLFTIRGWVSGLGGKFSLDSKPGSGTKIAIEIPIEKSN